MKRLATLFAAALVMLGLLVAFLPVSAVTPPLVYHSRGTANNGVGFLNLALPTSSTDAIIVIEWIGVGLTLPCSFILTPSDGFSNTFSSIGNCLPDANGGAIQAFSVASSSQSGTDSVSCNFGSPNTKVESCYAFDVNSPGAITLLASATGISSGMAVGISSAVPNSLVLVTAGMQYSCQAVVSLDALFQQYIPSTACNNGGDPIFQHGMSGGLENVGAGGLTSTFPLFVGTSLVWTELVVQIAPATASSTTTTYTATIVGWLMPDSTHFNNSYSIMIFPLAGMVVMLMPFMMFQRNREIGDKAIYPALFGLMVGATIADLSVSSTNNVSLIAIPFADLIVAGLLLFLWWWDS